jgi:hypothetical protein
MATGYHLAGSDSLGIDRTDQNTMGIHASQAGIQNNVRQLDILILRDIELSVHIKTEGPSLFNGNIKGIFTRHGMIIVV